VGARNFVWIDSVLLRGKEKASFFACDRERTVRWRRSSKGEERRGGGVFSTDMLLQGEGLTTTEDGKRGETKSNGGKSKGNSPSEICPWGKKEKHRKGEISPQGKRGQKITSGGDSIPARQKPKMGGHSERAPRLMTQKSPLMGFIPHSGEGGEKFWS